MPEITVRPFEPNKDYPTIEFWWKSRGHPAQRQDFLPPTGLMVSVGEDDVCAGFLFKTDAKIAVIGHVVSSPTTAASRIMRSQAINALIECLVDIAKAEQFAVVTASSNVARLNSRYEALGFVKSDENETHYGRVL